MIDDYPAPAKRLRAYREYERAGRNWKAALPGRTLAQIVPGDVERYVARRMQEVAPATVNRVLSFLRRLFNLAIADGKAETNPMCSVEFFKVGTVLQNAPSRPRRMTAPRRAERLLS